MTLPSLAGPLAATLLLGACCVTPPDAEEVMNTGFRTPRQCLETFQVGVRGDLARLEYRCLSVGYRDRNGLSQLGYREFRERELRADPWFAKGVADAEVALEEPLGPFRHRLVAESHGYRFEVVLVREDAWQAWAGERLLADELLEGGGFESHVEVSGGPAHAPAVLAIAELPPRLAHRDPDELRTAVTEFRIAQEWKIDSIRPLEQDDESPSSPTPPNP